MILTTPCSEFDGARDRNGYGRQRFEGKTWLAHRVAWVLVHGPIPNGLFVLHHCDNPPCINVEHLFLGTQADNVRDMSAKGRNHQQRKTHCPKGHEYVYFYGGGRGGRQCRECKVGPPHPRPFQTHCKRGHEFTPENTRLGSRGQRNCKTCAREVWEANRRRKRESAA